MIDFKELVARAIKKDLKVTKKENEFTNEIDIHVDLMLRSSARLSEEHSQDEKAIEFCEKDTKYRLVNYMLRNARVRGLYVVSWEEMNKLYKASHTGSMTSFIDALDDVFTKTNDSYYLYKDAED